MAYVQFENGEVIQTDRPGFHSDGKVLTNRAGKAAMAEYARAQLRDILPPNSTVYCVLRHRSASGMSREISFLVAVPGNENSGGKPYIRDITHRMVDAGLGWRLGKRGGLVIGGCGMDMGFAAVYALGCALWPNGTPEPHGMRNGEPDSDGGYALGHAWV